MVRCRWRYSRDCRRRLYPARMFVEVSTRKENAKGERRTVQAQHGVSERGGLAAPHGEREGTQGTETRLTGRPRGAGRLCMQRGLLPMVLRFKINGIAVDDDMTGCLNKGRRPMVGACERGGGCPALPGRDRDRRSETVGSRDGPGHRRPERRRVGHADGTGKAGRRQKVG